MSFWSIAFKSLLNRKLSVLLTLMSIGVGVTLLLGIERLRVTTQKGFESTISQTDVIVGARGAPLQILLYSVFHVGNPLNNVRMTSFEKYKANPEVSWAVPVSLGDSHNGFRVVGTDKIFFDKVKVGQKKSLDFKKGQVFDSLFDVVIGSEIAKRLGYDVGRKIVLAHGVGAAETFKHENTPFAVSGILSVTGTPIDRSLFVSLEAIEAIHVGWESGAPSKNQETFEKLQAQKFEPKAITAFFLGLKSRFSVFQIQNEINNDTDEPLTALLPGLTLRELWTSLGKAELAFRIISVFVLFSNLMGLLLVLLSSMNERRREMAIYRAVGAGSFFMGKLLLVESFILTIGGVLFGYSLLAAIYYVFSNVLETSLGFPVPIWSLGESEWRYLLVLLVAALSVALVPAWISRKQSLADGLSVKQ